VRTGSLLRGTLAVAASACAFGSISPLTIIATDRGMALQGIQTWRYLTASLLLMAIARWDARRQISSAATPPAVSIAPWYAPRVLFVAGSGQAMVATLALAALQWLPAATASFLFYTYPAWVTIITAVRGTERLDVTRIVALIMALAGIGAMVGAPTSTALHPTGLLIILAAALVYALYIPVLDHLQRGRRPTEVAQAIAVGGFVLFLTWSVTTGTLFVIPDAVALGASVMQGVLSSVAFIGFLAGLTVLGPVRTAITSTVEPFWTTLLGILLLGQPLGAGTLLGGIGIMTAVVLLQRRPTVDALSVKT